MQQELNPDPQIRRTVSLMVPVSHLVASFWISGYRQNLIAEKGLRVWIMNPNPWRWRSVSVSVDDKQKAYSHTACPTCRLPEIWSNKLRNSSMLWWWRCWRTSQRGPKKSRGGFQACTHFGRVELRQWNRRKDPLRSPAAPLEWRLVVSK